VPWEEGAGSPFFTISPGSEARVTSEGEEKGQALYPLSIRHLISSGQTTPFPAKIEKKIGDGGFCGVFRQFPSFWNRFRKNESPAGIFGHFPGEINSFV
jgi:hypothetical protein